ncbi:MAG: hypothetical protein IT433_00795 [Phycisphaerales bacterium]|nr:hypothetical protein [Phycisphaerales bacterium]
MNAVNLLAPDRLRSHAARTRLARWALVCGAYALLTGLLVLAGAANQGSRVSSARNVDALSAGAEQKEKDIKAVSARIAKLQRTESLAREITRHPDWGRLLDALAATRTEGIVFERLEFRVSPRAAGAKPGVTSATVRISGVAVSQVDAARYAVALQDLGTFDSVSPVETRAKGAGAQSGADLVAFSLTVGISCSISEPAP